MRFYVRTMLVTIVVCWVWTAVIRVETVSFLPSGLHYPFDLIRGHRLTMNVRVSEYDITLVQDPGSDFYETYLVVRNGKGGLTYMMINPDHSKVREPKIAIEDGVVRFFDASRPRMTLASVDLETMMIHAGLTGTHNVTDINFNDGWFNGGRRPGRSYYRP